MSDFPIPVPGPWRVESGRVMRLRPREDAVLRAGHGTLWVTFENGMQGGNYGSGDHVLAAGERLAVRAGQTVVIGAFGGRNAQSSFDWETPPRAQPGWRVALLELCASFAPPLAPAR